MTELKIRIERPLDRPILSADTDPTIGVNIQGPSLIRVPDWIERPLGAYYLYFADHKGSVRQVAAQRFAMRTQVLHLGAVLRQLDEGHVGEIFIGDRNLETVAETAQCVLVIFLAWWAIICPSPDSPMP